MRKHNWKISLGILGSAFALSACGSQQYVATGTVAAAAAPGTFTIPAKVDILLAEEDRGRMYEALPDISSSVNTMLSQLQSAGWDYHFGTIPLTTQRSLTLSRVVGSNYDANWTNSEWSAYGSWSAPFPGAAPNTAEEVSPLYFIPSALYNGFINSGDVSNASNGIENGLTNIANELTSSDMTTTGFLRPDAMLVVLVVGTGEDTSLVNYCPESSLPGSDAYSPCVAGGVLPSGAVIPTCSSGQILSSGPNAAGGASALQCDSRNGSLSYFQSKISAVKTNSNLLQFYAAVSNESVSECNGIDGGADQGTRYQEMASALGGQSFDICSGSSSAVSNAITAIGNNLQNVRVDMRTQYLPLASQPNPATIVVTRNDGTVIPQSNTNGWSYVGYQTVDLINYPTPMDSYTGYVVELNGSYELTGDQTATVTYTDLGLQNSN